MIQENEVPDPGDSGADGQQSAGGDEPVVSAPQIVGQPMASAITGLTSTNARAFGGEVASTLIAGATSQMSVELASVKKELHDERKKNEQITNELSDERVRSAVLSERIDSYRSNRHLKNVGVAIGSILIGLGFQLFTSDSKFMGLASIVVGVTLLLFSWWSAPKGEDK